MSRDGPVLGGTDVPSRAASVYALLALQVWWHTWLMARRSLTVEVDEKLLAAAEKVADRTGVSTGELYERALRDVLARDFGELMDDIAAEQAERGVTLSEDARVTLAYEELRASRAGRRSAS